MTTSMHHVRHLTFLLTACALGVGHADLARAEGGAGERPQVAASDDHLDTLRSATRDLSRISRGAGRERRYTKVALTVEEVVDRAGKDPDRLLRWVRENVRYEPYQGALRSPRGVLAARSANAPDMARLLVALYHAAGLEARLVWGEVDRKEARRLLVDFAGAATLARGGEPVEDESFNTFDPRWLQIAREHAWVEVKHAGRFQAADPLLGTALGATPGKREGAGGALPASMQSTLGLVLTARFEDDTEQVLIAREGALDDFAYRTMTLSFVQDVRLAHTTRPVFRVGDRVKTGDYFPREKLSSLTLRFDLKVGQRRSQWEQHLYRKSQGVDVFAFDQQHLAIAVLPAWTSDAQVARVGAGAFDDAVTRIREWADASAKAGEAFDARSFEKQTRALIDRTARVFPYALARHLDRLTFALADSMGVKPVLHQPRIILTSLVRDRDQLYLEADIQGELLDAVAALGLPRATASGFVTMHGRLENQVRGLVLGALVDTAPYTTARLFSEAQKQRVPVMTLHAGNIRKAPWPKGLPEGVREQITRQVRKQGDVVLTPQRAVSVGAAKRHGWWRVDPVTGGIHGDAWHGLLNIASAKRSPGSEPQGEVMLALMKLVTRQLSTWMTALQGSGEFEAAVCDASRDTIVIGRALCATRKARPMPALEACLTPGGGGETSAAGGDDPLALKMPSCDEVVTPTRCGAVIARAFLGGELAFTPRGEESPRVGLTCK